MIREMSLCGLGQTAPNPVLTTMRHFRHEFEDHIRAHRCRAGVCQDLALSPCENSCPLHMNIPRFLQLYREGRMEEAFESVVIDNPLPASTGRVCQHPCEVRCRRHNVDAAVNMREVHRTIADTILLSENFEAMAKRIAARRLPLTGRKICVVGAGPAGLTAAFYLSLLGHEVTVYDSHAAAGGMLRYALPEYRLPKSILDREIEIISRTGVQFVFNTTLGTNLTLDDLDAKFDGVFISIGTWKDSNVTLPGSELKGVMPALGFLEAVDKGETVNLGRRVVVIGGGNAAIDSARSAMRLGASVTVIYRRERKDMPAIHEETEAAEQEGAHFVFLSAPHRVVGEKGAVKAIEVVKTRLGAFDASGRRRPISTEEIQSFKCDSVILAVGEAVDTELCSASGFEISKNKTLDVDRYSMKTSRNKFYAGGDVISGATNVSNAMGYGKKAARLMDQDLMDEARFQAVFPSFDYDQTPPEDPTAKVRHISHPLAPGERVKTFEECVLALTPEETLDEANRCLRCDIGESGVVTAGHR